MSRKNKVNPGQYTQAGRLTPDDAARERGKQNSLHTGISNRESAQEDENEQTSSKSGSRSSAKKAAESKYVATPHPASEKVEGAFGRESND